VAVSLHNLGQSEADDIKQMLPGQKLRNWQKGMPGRSIPGTLLALIIFAQT
jgi:hypothetical protein